jgi:hypothetical protein
MRPVEPRYYRLSADTLTNAPTGTHLARLRLRGIRCILNTGFLYRVSPCVARRTVTAYQFFVGVRPISFLGAEMAYLDFGHAYGTLNSAVADLSLKGEGAFGMLYLPVPVIDVYLEAGFVSD